MTELIQQLVNEHVLLDKELQDIMKPGISAQEKHEKILQAKNLIIRHIEHEDKELYTVLNRAASSNPVLEQTLEIFAVEMKEITEKVFHFFNTFENEMGESFQFSREFGKLVGLLKHRIRREESILYEEYEKLFRVKQR